MVESLDRKTLKALSVETRQDIIRLISNRPHTASELSKKTGKHVTTITEHLDLLAESKLIERLETIESECFESYGMTETYSHVAIKNLSSKEKYFMCLDGVFCKLEDENLVVVANHIQTEGLKTTDCAILIDSKHFELLGRSDFVINSGGYKFHPEVLEEKLEKEIPFPYFILGEQNSEFGEIVTFYVENTYSKELEKSLKNMFQAKFKRYEIPKKIYFVTKFSTTASGKINKLATQKKAFEH